MVCYPYFCHIPKSSNIFIANKNHAFVLPQSLFKFTCNHFPVHTTGNLHIPHQCILSLLGCTILLVENWRIWVRGPRWGVYLWSTQLNHWSQQLPIFSKIYYCRDNHFCTASYFRTNLRKKNCPSSKSDKRIARRIYHLNHAHYQQNGTAFKLKPVWIP